MLTGRIELRRVASIVLGCFLIFGAVSIANGLIGMVHQQGTVVPGRTFDSPAPAYAKPSPGGAPQNSPQHDAYVGAALPQQ